jgi:hypothetical protein
MFLMPFHAAEQHNKERISDSAEYPIKGYKLRDFPMSPVLCEQHPSRGYKLRAARYCGPGERLPFLVRFCTLKNRA